MDYFQGVVTEYLRANRSTFVNTECLIQLDDQPVPAKGSHWYCDAVAVNFIEMRVYLCEVSYSTTLTALIKRLSDWSYNWPAIRNAIHRDCGVSKDWHVVPWLFIPKERRTILDAKVARLSLRMKDAGMPIPLVKHLEDVVPWKYQTWNRKLEELADENTGEGFQDAGTSE
jgi:hypothetical protein